MDLLSKVSLVIFTILCFQVIPLHLSGKKLEGNVYHCRGGPRHWGDWFDTCSGDQQSPIDVPCSTCSSVHKENFTAFIRSDTYFEIPTTLRIVRSIDNVGLKATYKKKKKVTITGGPLQDVYILDHIHFHWGDNNLIGSEHSINGRTFSMEAHQVFYNSKYRSMKSAQAKEGGIVMIAYFFKVVPEMNDPAMNCITCCFRQLFTKAVTTNIPRPFPIGLLLPPFHRKYLVYSGSLTTPPCYESVTWILYDRILDISRDNILKFRGLYCVDPGLRNNYRPIQPLNGRLITARP